MYNQIVFYDIHITLTICLSRFNSRRAIKNINTPSYIMTQPMTFNSIHKKSNKQHNLQHKCASPHDLKTVFLKTESDTTCVHSSHPSPVWVRRWPAAHPLQAPRPHSARPPSGEHCLWLRARPGPGYTQVCGNAEASPGGEVLVCHILLRWGDGITFWNNIFTRGL